MHGTYWNRHKLDHPVRPVPGNYKSGTPAIMNWQIRRAQAAGITGFIVSWKDTPRYRRILPRLERVANADHFKLAMEYEGLNASRQPLPVWQVRADFRYFAAHYARNRAWYRIGGKPLTMWRGTAKFAVSAVARVTGPVRHSILVLNSAANLAQYWRLAAYTDGDAYYWSSVNPATARTWGSKLRALSAAVHRDHHIWIAPFAPGFNDTLIGGHILVPRDSGATLRAEYATAVRSSPDILGLISWNEWTENTYVEPSQHFGYTYLKLLHGLIRHG
jgi:hypothetical protein